MPKIQPPKKYATAIAAAAAMFLGALLVGPLSRLVRPRPSESPEESFSQSSRVCKDKFTPLMLQVTWADRFAEGKAQDPRIEWDEFFWKEREGYYQIAKELTPDLSRADFFWEIAQQEIRRISREEFLDRTSFAETYKQYKRETENCQPRG